ncbi:hypothetical protein, partial [Ralstonia pseudosolanacearum]|uniref:hypothetical protein n=1 Tax=Ralstonia pseudosolanacearum TaxID=1310165 RepID=UPI003CF16107
VANGDIADFIRADYGYVSKALKMNGATYGGDAQKAVGTYQFEAVLTGERAYTYAFNNPNFTLKIDPLDITVDWKLGA